MTALEFIKSHWLEILVALSVLPVVLRAILQPARGTSLDRWLSRYEALVVDVRKVLKSFGAVTIGQDEESCVVYGMPKTAVEAGVVDVVAPLGMIAPEIVRTVR